MSAANIPLTCSAICVSSNPRSSNSIIFEPTTFRQNIWPWWMSSKIPPSSVCVRRMASAIRSIAAEPPGAGRTLMTSLQGHCGIRRRGIPVTFPSVRGGNLRAQPTVTRRDGSVLPPFRRRYVRVPDAHERDSVATGCSNPGFRKTEQSSTGSQKGAATPLRHQYSNHVWTGHRRKLLPPFNSEHPLGEGTKNELGCENESGSPCGQSFRPTVSASDDKGKD